MQNPSFEGARRWVVIAGVVYVASGIGLAAISFAPDLLAWVTRLAVPELGTPDRALATYAGIAGGLTVGFGVAMACAGRAVTPASALVRGLLAWFAVDTAASLAHGSWQNALGNVLFLLVGLPPLWLLAARSRDELDERHPTTA